MADRSRPDREQFRTLFMRNTRPSSAIELHPSRARQAPSTWGYSSPGWVQHKESTWDHYSVGPPLAGEASAMLFGWYLKEDGFVN